MQALIDKDAIRDLVLSYSRAVDRQDFALLRALYTEDGREDDHSGLYSGTASGYVDWLETMLPRLSITTHAVQNHLIVLDGADQGQGEVYCLAYHRMPVEGGGWQDLVHGNRYFDHYRKDADGAWRFARRAVTVDWKQIGPATWDPVAALAPTFGTPDPVLPLARAPGFQPPRLIPPRPAARIRYSPTALHGSIFREGAGI